MRPRSANHWRGIRRSAPARLRRAARGRRRSRIRDSTTISGAQSAACDVVGVSAGRAVSAEPSAAYSLRNSADCSGASSRARACVAKCRTARFARRQFDDASRRGIETRELDHVGAFEGVDDGPRLDGRVRQPREPLPAQSSCHGSWPMSELATRQAAIVGRVDRVGDHRDLRLPYRIAARRLQAPARAMARRRSRTDRSASHAACRAGNRQGGERQTVQWTIRQDHELAADVRASAEQVA